MVTTAHNWQQKWRTQPKNGNKNGGNSPPLATKMVATVHKWQQKWRRKNRWRAERDLQSVNEPYPSATHLPPTTCMGDNGGGPSLLLSIKEETFSLGSHCFGHLCLQLPPLFKAGWAPSDGIKCSPLVRFSVKKHHSPHHGKRGDRGSPQWRGQRRRWSSLYIIITSFQGSSPLLSPLLMIVKMKEKGAEREDGWRKSLARVGRRVTSAIHRISHKLLAQDAVRWWWWWWIDA